MTANGQRIATPHEQVALECSCDAMIWDEKKNTYRLSSGKLVYANRGILGLGLRDDVLYEGYDGHVNDNEENEDGCLTPAERNEIAEEMIARWRQWADRMSKPKK